MDRSSLYLMFVAKLLGEPVGEEFLDCLVATCRR